MIIRLAHMKLLIFDSLTKMLNSYGATKVSIRTIRGEGTASDKQHIR